MIDDSVTDEAEVVILGGGVLGCSIAYHLCRLGISDVLVIERNDLAGEATARAAGLVLHAASDSTTIRMVARTRAAMAELAAEFGEDAGFRQVGSLSALQSEERLRDMHVIEARLAAEGVPVERIDAREARKLCPWLDLGKATWISRQRADGYVDGARLAMSYARAARRLGARIRRGVAVERILGAEGRIAGVVTSAGAIRGGRLVMAAGVWSIALLRALGWGMPAAPVRSHYWITAPDGNGLPDRPNVLLLDLRTYFRSEVGGMVLGFQEPRSQTYDPLALPATMETAMRYDEAAELDLLVEHAEALRPLVPDLDRWRFAHHISGLSAYTPDGKILLGPVPGLQNLYLAGGDCGSGIAMSGGIGLAMACMIAGKDPGMNTNALGPGRFGAIDPATPALRERCAAARSAKSVGRSGTAGATGA